LATDRSTAPPQRVAFGSEAFSRPGLWPPWWWRRTTTPPTI